MDIVKEDKKGKDSMLEKDITLWGMHAGKTGNPTKLFFDNNLLGLGWVLMGDLSKLSFLKRLILDRF